MNTIYTKNLLVALTTLSALTTLGSSLAFAEQADLKANQCPAPLRQAPGNYNLRKLGPGSQIIFGRSFVADSSSQTIQERLGLLAKITDFPWALDITLQGQKDSGNQNGLTIRKGETFTVVNQSLTNDRGPSIKWFGRGESSGLTTLQLDLSRQSLTNPNVFQKVPSVGEVTIDDDMTLESLSLLLGPDTKICISEKAYKTHLNSKLAYRLGKWVSEQFASFKEYVEHGYNKQLIKQSMHQMKGFRALDSLIRDIRTPSSDSSKSGK